MAFLNSPLGLFVLSSVLLAGLGRLYADYQNARAETKVKREALEEVLTEMEYRGTQAYYYARDIAGIENVTAVNSCVLLWRMVVGDKEYRPAVRSMKEVHWLGLITRARALTELDAEDAERAVIQLQFHTDGGRCPDPRRQLAHVAELQRFSDRLRRFVRHS